MWCCLNLWTAGENTALRPLFLFRRYCPRWRSDFLCFFWYQNQNQNIFRLQATSCDLVLLKAATLLFFFFVFVEQKRVSTLESLPIVILIFAFISQVHYFVIITNPKSSSLSRYLSFFPSLSLSPLWFHECWNWILHLKVNFHDGITQISLPLFRLYASIPLSFMLHNLDASLHLLWFNLFIWRHLFFFMLNSPAHVFPLCIVMLPLSKSACMCVCALAHKFLIQTFQIWK